MKLGFRSLLALTFLLISAPRGGAQITPLDPVTIAEDQPVEGVDQLRIFQRDPLAAPREAPPFPAFELEVRQHILPKAARERQLLRDLADCSTGQLHAQLLEQWRAARRFIYLHEEHDLVSALFARADLKNAAAETLGLADWEDGYPEIGDDDIDIEDAGRTLWVRLAAVDWASAREIALSLRGQETMILSLGDIGDADWAILPPERIPDFLDLLTEMDDNTLFAKNERTIPPDLYYWVEARLPDRAEEAISRLAATSGNRVATDVARKITHDGAREAALEIAGMTYTRQHAELPPRINSLETFRMVLAASATRLLYPHWRLEILQATERLDAATAATWVQALTPLESVSEGGERLFSRWAELDGPAALAHLVSLTRQEGLKLNSLTCEVFAAASGDDLRLRVLRDLPETLRPYALQGFMATAGLGRTDEWLALPNKNQWLMTDPLLTRIALTDPAKALSLQRRLFPDASSPDALGDSGLVAAWLLHDFDGAAAFLKDNGRARYLHQYVQLLPLGQIVSLQDQLNPAIFDWSSLDGTWKWLMFENPDTILPALQGRTSDPRFRGFLLYLAAHAAPFHPLEAVKFALSLKPEPSLEEMQPILDRAAGRSEAIRNYDHERAFLPTSAPQPRSGR
ncbi:MAG: hypothetical protein V4675_24655 [Verrucomicrobiota bacterium]